MNKKILTGIIILISLLLVGSIYYKFIGKSDKSIEWNLPENQKNDQELKKIQKSILESPRISSQDAIRRRTEEKQILSIYDIKQDDDWAIVKVKSLDLKTKETIPSEGVFFLAKKINGKWELENDNGELIEWLPNVPETLLSKEDKDTIYMLLGVPNK